MATKKYTVEQLARMTKRSAGVITRLCKTDQLTAERGHTKSGRPAWLIPVENKDAMVMFVHKLVPRGGYTKNVKKPKTPANLVQVLRFMELSNEKRLMLLELGEKTDETTLEVLLGLV